MDEKNDKKATRQARQVFAVVERNGKSYWVRIGAAFGNYDGSETVLLDALPVNGKMQIRSQSVKESAPKTKAAVETATNDDGD